MTTIPILREYRSPGRPLQAVSLKLPAEQLEVLDSWADRLKCHRSSLCRALLVQGLEQLEASSGEGQSP